MARRSSRRNPFMPTLPKFEGFVFDNDFPSIPVEVYPSNERLTGQQRELFPGVFLLQQSSITDTPQWVTFCDGREIIVLRDADGRRSYVYRSFSGTQGKTQGYWYPFGGAFAHNGKNIWLIKSGIRRHHGMGRSRLTAFIEYINKYLPHSDEETDQWLMAHFGLTNSGWAMKDEFETKPMFNLIGKQSLDVVEKWKAWATETWKSIGLNPVWGQRDLP